MKVLHPFFLFFLVFSVTSIKNYSQRTLRTQKAQRMRRFKLKKRRGGDAEKRKEVKNWRRAKQLFTTFFLLCASPPLRFILAQVDSFFCTIILLRYLCTLWLCDDFFIFHFSFFILLTTFDHHHFPFPSFLLPLKVTV